MPASAYLTGADLETYGVPSASPATVMRASILIDNYLKRPDGLLWMPDTTGAPAYMASRDPLLTLTSAAAIPAGKAIAVTIPGFVPDETIIGEAVVLDRINDSLIETCWVQSFSGNTVTLNTVALSHPGPVTIDIGMTITDESLQPGSRSLVQLGQWPIAKIISGVGRYGYGRRSDQMMGSFDDINMLSMLASFGGPPAWETFEVQASSVSQRDGFVWIPSGILLSYFTDVKLRYIAGWQASALPAPIKLACAMLAQAIMDQGMGPNVRRFNTGKVDIQKFSATVLDDDVKSILRPYRATILA